MEQFHCYHHPGQSVHLDEQLKPSTRNLILSRWNLRSQNRSYPTHVHPGLSVCSHCCSTLNMQGPLANHPDANSHSVKFRNLLMPTSSSPWNRNPEDIQTHTIKSTAVMRQYMFQAWLLGLSTFLTPDCWFACLLVYVNNSVHASPLVT